MTRIDQNALQEELRSLLRRTQSDATPNINVMNELLRDLTAIKFNLKFFGYPCRDRRYAWDQGSGCARC